MIRAILKWLGHEPLRDRVGLRPHRLVELDLGISEAYALCLDAVTAVLGANVLHDDRAQGTIDIGFGLIDAERLHVTCEAAGDAHARIRIEARYPAGAAPRLSSTAVDRLAEFLETRTGH